MSVSGPVHPLDVDLADLVDGVLDDARAAELEAHVTFCLACLVKLDRLRGAGPAFSILDRPLASPAFVVPLGDDDDHEPAIGDVWLAGDDEYLLVLVVGVDDVDDERVSVAPATFDVEAADEQTLVVDGLGGLAIHPRLATDVARSALRRKVGRAEVDGGHRGTAVVDASDPRLEIRELLADRLGSIDTRPPDGPSFRPGRVGSALIDDLRDLRGDACAVRPLADWGDVLLAHRAGWEPIATIDEVGIVLVVLDTPHGLADDTDFDVARSVLTRFNCTALVVLAGGVSDLADVFDSSSLNYGIDAPSGRHTPPRPLISGLSPYDAVAKYLDQTTGVRASDLPTRGPVSRVDVGDILRESAAAALGDAVRQGARFKIAPKRRGYESLADAGEGFEAALARAFGAGPVVDDLLGLVPRSGG